jgi:predicted DCC family thiol-disulfide oxidoreductase YuxK
LYDGVCAFCDRAVQFVLHHDADQRFRFAALQSDFARRALARHGRDPRGLDTICLLLDAGTPAERLLVKSDAILALLRELGGGWRLFAGVGLLPRALRDRGYEAFARHRYHWFGRYDSCALPPADVRQRFIDDDDRAGEEPEGRASAPR